MVSNTDEIENGQDPGDNPKSPKNDEFEDIGLPNDACGDEFF